jgi:hypothetical protein
VETYESARVPAPNRTGSVTATQRFGSDDRLSFRRVVPHTEDIEQLVVRIAEACEAWLSRQGFGAEDEGDADGDDDAPAVIQQASLLGCCRPAYVIAPGAAKLIAPGAAKLIAPGRPT